MNKKDLSAVFWMALFCFSVGVAASRYQAFLSFDPQDPTLKFLVGWLSVNTRFDAYFKVAFSVSTFTVLFKIMLTLYETTPLWNFFHREDDLNGTWVYIFKDGHMNCLVFGMFEVSHSMSGISVEHGICWYQGTNNLTEENKRGNWFSKEVARGDKEHWVAYKMDIPNPKKGHEESGYHGVMKVNISFDKRMNTKIWEGTICDHNAQVSHNGRIRAKRLARKDISFVRDWQNLPEVIKKYLEVDVMAEDHVCLPVANMPG